MIKRFFITIFFTGSILLGQVEFFPGELNIQPFTANILEPKLGFLFQNKNDELRLDIGNSIDILQYHADSKTFSFGADLFTYTLLRSEDNFHFPVDAVDYLFGINFGYKVKVHNYSFGFRARISHISAHFADGHYDNAKQEWRNGQKPRVYSREFIEVMPFYRYNNFRFYFGLTYIFNVEPDYVKRDQYHAGFDYFRKDLIAENISPFIAYDFKYTTVKSRFPNHSFSAGIKFGEVFGRGMSLYYNYYDGNNFHGEYFDQKSKYSAVGINLDL